MLEADVTPPPEPAREEPPKPPAVSLWHKIFGAPSQPAESYSERPAAEAPSSERAEQAQTSATDEFFGGEVRSLSGEDVADADFVSEESTGAPTISEDEGEPDEQRRGRPRRRRRGGRGRRGGERQRGEREARVHESAGADEVGGDFDDLGDDDEDAVAIGADVGDTKQSADDADIDDGETSRESRARSAAQRAIPSWDEAIGFIVEANMQNRSQRRPASRPDARGGRSRGGRRR